MNHLLIYPPLAITECVPITTLFTLDIIANIAESGIKVVLIPYLDSLIARSCP